MTEAQWQAFSSFRTSFKAQCNQWNSLAAELIPLQEKAAAKDTPPYPHETAVVYSTDFDKITQADEIRLIVIGDNPGKDEQLAKNRRYLVGQSGKIAEGFFRRNPELAVDFRKDVLILNKTPVHTAKTPHLRVLLKEGSHEIQTLIQNSQLWMAEQTAVLHQSLLAGSAVGSSPDIWLVGYTELKGRGLFIPYRDQLLAGYRSGTALSGAFTNHVFVYQHFSMNRFLIDLAEFRRQHEEFSLKDALNMLGTQHRKEIFAC